MRENLGRGRELIAPKLDLCDEKFKRFRDRDGKFAGSGEPNTTCRFCGSATVVKSGFNPAKYGWKQRYWCRNCGSTFTPTTELVKGNMFPQGTDKDILQMKREGLGKFCKLVRGTIYPFLDFELPPQAKYNTNAFLDLLTHVAMTHDFTENGSKTFKLARDEVPSADAFFYHLSKLEWKEVERRFTEVFERIFEIAGENDVFKRRKFDVAVDFHDWLYYGKEAPMVLGTQPKKGTHHAYKFATISILERGFRFTLLALPVGKYSEMVGVMEKLLRYAMRRVKINRVYCDRWFYRTEVIRVLKKLGLKFIIQAPVTRTSRVKTFLNDDAKGPVVIDYTVKRKNRPCASESVKLFAVRNERMKDEMACFVTNLDVSIKNADHLAEVFKKRWGIETSYRVMQDFKPRTTSRRYVTRLFYFMFSVCLYNLWVLANLIVGKIVLRFIPSQPFITAKVFGVILYATSLPFDPG